MNESQAWTTAKTDSSEPVTLDTLKQWKKTLESLPPPLVSIDMRYTLLRAKKVSKFVDSQSVPLGAVQVNDSPSWWPDLLARANYHKAPSKWLWLGKDKPWWFRRWLS